MGTPTALTTGNGGGGDHVARATYFLIGATEVRGRQPLGPSACTDKFSEMWGPPYVVTRTPAIGMRLPPAKLGPT